MLADKLVSKAALTQTFQVQSVGGALNMMYFFHAEAETDVAATRADLAGEGNPKKRETVTAAGARLTKARDNETWRSEQLETARANLELGETTAVAGNKALIAAVKYDTLRREAVKIRADNLAAAEAAREAGRADTWAGDAAVAAARSLPMSATMGESGAGRDLGTLTPALSNGRVARMETRASSVRALVRELGDLVR